MSRKALLVLGVFLAGAGIACAISISMFDINTADEFGPLAAMILVLGGFPAVLAALEPRAALALLMGGAVLLGIWAASILSIPGDGAIGGILILVVDVVLTLYGLAAIGLRKLIIKSPEA